MFKNFLQYELKHILSIFWSGILRWQFKFKIEIPIFNFNHFITCFRCSFPRKDKQRTICATDGTEMTSMCVPSGN